jgi:hypothetical protein
MLEYTDVSRLDAGAALGVLERAQRARRHAEVQEALAMLRVVHAYRHQIPTDKVRLAGDGTGLIDDFACLELAAALHRTVESVTAEVVELLNLETRLPRLWEMVVACGIPLWQARRIARVTGELSLARALWVDATIAPFATRLAPSRLLRFVEALVVQADPAAAEALWSRAPRPRIEIGRDQRDGLRDVYGWLTAADAIFLDAALDQLSGILAGQGSDQDAAERRATALGILATPARALAIIQQSIAQPTLTGEPIPELPPIVLSTVPEEQPRDEAASRRAPDDERLTDMDGPGPRSPFGCPGHTCGTITVDPDRLLPTATLVIHLSDDTLTPASGSAGANNWARSPWPRSAPCWATAGCRFCRCSTRTGSCRSTTTRSPTACAGPCCCATASRSSPMAATRRSGSIWTTPSRIGTGQAAHRARPGRTTSGPCAARPTGPRPTPAGGCPSPGRAPSPG